VPDPTPPTPTTAPGTMGLKGLLWNNIGNASAMMLLGTAFFIQMGDARESAKEDRALFRAVQAANDQRFEKLGGQIEHNTRAVLQAVERLDAAHRRLDADVSRLKTTVAGPIPPPREKDQP